MRILYQKVNKYPFLLHQTQFSEFLGVKMIGIIYIIITAELFKGLKSEVHYNKPRHFTFNSKEYGVKPNSHADNLKAPLHCMDLQKSANV
jgi:hypothetical protein